MLFSDAFLGLIIAIILKKIKISEKFPLKQKDVSENSWEESILTDFLVIFNQVQQFNTCYYQQSFFVFMKMGNRDPADNGMGVAFSSEQSKAEFS